MIGEGSHVKEVMFLLLQTIDVSKSCQQVLFYFALGYWLANKALHIHVGDMYLHTYTCLCVYSLFLGGYCVCTFI